jgi:hypothetical protein
MENVYIIRGRLQEFYAKYSKVIDKAIQFLLAIVTFTIINKNLGFMEAASSPIVALGLAIICTFFSMNTIVLMATVLILVHIFAVSLGAFAITAVIFLLMYIFYFQLTPKMALIVLLTPLAFVLKIPYVIPAVCGLVVAPVSLIAVACGTIVYYMMEYVKKSASTLTSTGIKDVLSGASKYVKQVFENKEMWTMIAAFIICFFVVYIVRRTAMDHAWKIAIVAGTIANVIVIAVGDVSMGLNISYGGLIAGSILSIIIGLVLEIFLFSVDYGRAESLQYEDDEYYYYVKAIPKVSVAGPEKMVKRINERQETEIIDTEVVRMKSEESKSRRADAVSRNRDAKDIDRELLNQSLRKDLDMED